jgi:TatD DNase family protein
MSYVDAHCHLSDPRAAGDLERTLASCARVGITRFVLGGVDPADWDRQEQLDRTHPGTFVKVFGLHPWWVHEHSEAELDVALAALERRLAGCAALGETGLDAARDRFKTSRDRQLSAFEAQLALAARADRPVVLHVVRAHEAALERLAAAAPPRGGLVHSFSGTWGDARRYLDLGLTLSVSARITHPRAHELRETVRRAPADRLVFETDAPDQPPYGSPDKVHTPLSLLKVVDEVSKIRAEPAETLLKTSLENLRRILRF